MASRERSTPSITTTANTMRSPMLALLIYPLTLFVGSLFSVLSPTAQGIRSSSQASPSPMTPSLASSVHLSPPSPVNYFARKDNIFNLYFVKVGWLWTTIAFASLLVSQPAYTSPSTHQPRRLAQALLRYALATAAWYLTTQWFFGPAIIDRGFVVTGGKCEEILRETPVEVVEREGSVSRGLERLFTAAACKAAGGVWAGGHDVSGHVFMLVLATSMLVFEAFGAVRRGGFGARGGEKKQDGDGDGEGEREGDEQAEKEGEEGGVMGVWSLRFVAGVVGLGWWMLFMTSIWFHTWLEKWSGLLIALGTIYVVYILPLGAPAWRDTVGIPGV
ncbi:putative inositol phospholipid biosynthesis protein Scs3 [Aspergillus clavatus NRRL 1]|uniref:Acyl-coenzyme A diphosphatase SCS3 n=1 Tax=Aspergillus clavatus (strain ATCC 1007 / CBS 513.65 / DSM 816 / NCTC 3887 / NRRL 1 / QM 1276 / 107) TaxID=344612 RepID=A1CR84_ASPCL|nr:inositol phospholipid biosynthesis protein Scs3, putative [Aspergillus clavatus NRRL 1]EAW08155.1 inositol phospholipid biosynthesis protein Scs3, putative [Aspergillus clavatus NRRL 1]